MVTPLTPTTTPPPKRARLDHLAALGDASRDASENVVTPINQSIGVTNIYVPRLQHTSSTVSTTSGLPIALGTTGGTLAGVAGVKDLLDGMATGDRKKVWSGATDVTVSATTLSALGVMGGAAFLGPAGTALLGIRAFQRMDTQDRGTQLKGLSDLATAGALACALCPMTAPVRAGVALVAAGVGVLKGLHDLREGHDLHKPRTRLDGFGGLVSSAGILMLSTGFGTIPGLGLVIAGSILPVAGRIKFLHQPIDRAVGLVDRHLYKTAVKVDGAMTRVSRAINPSMEPVRRAMKKFDPVRERVRRVEDKGLAACRKGLAKFAQTRFATYLNEGAGNLMRRIKPYIVTEDQERAEEESIQRQAPGS